VRVCEDAEAQNSVQVENERTIRTRCLKVKYFSEREVPPTRSVGFSEPAYLSRRLDMKYHRPQSVGFSDTAYLTVG
jgi:hypothetical protein